VLQLADAHRGLVTCVRWLADFDGLDTHERVAVSGGMDGQVVVWDVTEAAWGEDLCVGSQVLRQQQSLWFPARRVSWEEAGGGISANSVRAKPGSAAVKAVEASDGRSAAPINSVCAWAVEGRAFVAAASSEGQVAVWSSRDGVFALVGVVELPPTQIVLSLDAVPVPADDLPPTADSVCLVTGGVSGNLVLRDANPTLTVLAECDVGDWIQAVRASAPSTHKALIACGSSDSMVRLFELASSSTKRKGASLAFGSLNREHRVATATREGALRLGAVLPAHEQAVTCVSWAKLPSGESAQCFVSASVDCGVVMWQELEGTWSPVLRLTAGSGRRQPVTSTCVSPCGRIVWACGVRSSTWAFTLEGGLSTPASLRQMRENEWIASHSLSGHSGGVMGARWGGASQPHLVTVSTDQTARVHLLVRRDRSMERSLTLLGIKETRESLWREVARPQVHGYDFSCVAASRGGDRFFSGSEEKVIRVFDPPGRFLATRGALLGGSEAEAMELAASVPAARAYCPELGLSNKALAFDGTVVGNSSFLPTIASPDADVPNRPDGHAPASLVAAADTAADRLKLEQVLKDQARAEAQRIAGRADASLGQPTTSQGVFDEDDGVDAPSVHDAYGAPLGSRPAWSAPELGGPLDMDLSGETLWPEVNKLYGHGDSLVALAMRPRGDLLASSSKARTPQQATVRLWNTSTGMLVQELPGHESTVIGLAFSPCGAFLATVSRDRHMCLYQLRGEEWVLLARVKAHKRMAWCVAWAPCRPDDPSRALVSGGREGSCRLWELNTAGTMALRSLGEVGEPSSEAVSALEFAPLWCRTSEEARWEPLHILAVGFDDGQIHLMLRTDSGWVLLDALPRGVTPSGAVRSIAWQPSALAPADVCRFATASADWSVRVFRFDAAAAVAPHLPDSARVVVSSECPHE
jgi:WD40 repeat protein